MSFKFRLLSLERDNCECDKENSNFSKPKNKSPSKKKSNQQKKFTKTVQKCHMETENKESFGKCMSKGLSK